MILEYIDYYFIFTITFLFFFVSVFDKKCYINNKITVLFYKSNNIKLLLYPVLLMIFIIIINFIFVFNFSNIIYFYPNYNFIYKFFLYIFSFFYIFMFNYFSKLSKFFSYEAVWVLAFSIFSLSMLLQVNNFLYFYILLESYSLSILSLIAMKRLSKKTLNASFNYLVLNIVTSCVILYNISFLYFSAGLLNFMDINDCLLNIHNLDYKYLLIINLFSLFLCFFIKLSIFPFSLILLDIYSNLSFIFIFFFLIIPKFCFSIFLFNNFTFFLNSYMYVLFSIFLYLVLFTSFLHAFLSISNINIKNLIINTSFSNAPFLVAPLFCKNVFLINSFFNFSIIYFFNLFCFFSLFFIICIEKNRLFLRFTNIFGLINSNVIISFSIFVTFLSISSIPPFSGFFAKFFIFYFFIEYKMFFIYFFLSFINLLIIFSYLKVFKNIFIKKKNFYLKSFNNKNKFLYYFVSVFIIFNILFIYFFDFLYKIFFLLFNFFNYII